MSWKREDVNGKLKPHKEDLRKRQKIKTKDADKNKVSLKIDDKTIILVSKENCTEEYAENYRKRLEKTRENSLKTN